MTSNTQDIDQRERKHQIRARRARWIGRLLIPVMFMLISASLWSDPRISAQLERGLSIVTAMIDPGAENPTAENQDAPAFKVDRNNLPTVSQLPTSKIKVNRHP